jgi:hypothetical protein
MHACLAVLAAACLTVVPLAAARAGLLIEADMAGQGMRLVVDRPAQRVLLTMGGTATLVDLAGGLVYLRQDGKEVLRAHARYRPGYGEPPPYRIEYFGPGPMIAGNVSSYEVLFAEERVCAEMMLSGWMTPFADPAVRAIALLERPATRPGGDPDPCAAIPFATYAAAGWPLMAGKVDHPTFVTTAIHFDYQPSPEELATPERFREVPIEELQSRAGLPRR